MWDLILDPFVNALMLLYSLVGENIVIAIILFTIIVRMLMYPLTARQQNSMKKQQELAPEIEKLKEKYKDDKQKLSQAQMDLYKEHGINPLGGCLPLLIQFPIFIGLYQAINFSLASMPYQLVDVPERLWGFLNLNYLFPVQNIWLGMDLTHPPTPPNNPPYALVLPVIVMATMWLQTRLSMGRSQSSASGGQAAQMTRSMNTIMPIMFGAFALSFSVGLSIYFVTGNVVAIIQYSPWGQKVLNRFFVRDSKPSTNDTKELKDGKTKSKSKSKKKAT